jgi:hypothetical protein
MYRLAVIVNENEASHSKYADTLNVLKSAIERTNENGKRANNYHFTVFDKFNISTLFEGTENNISGFDALFIATNALAKNETVHKALVENGAALKNFIESNRGVFISSQKKLSNGNLKAKEFYSTEILPVDLDYYLFDRPENHSSEGDIAITGGHSLLEFPTKIDAELVKDRCEQNNFMVHKYRSLIIPKQRSSYVTILRDEKSPSVTQKSLNYLDEPRDVLLAGVAWRVVISSMALDWANHEELLSNILTFITERKKRILFVMKDDSRSDEAVELSIIRANTINLPYRVIEESDLQQYTKFNDAGYAFSSRWSAAEVDAIYLKMLSSAQSLFTIHHVCALNDEKGNHRLNSYRNYSSIDIVKENVIRSMIGCFHENGWNKSIWTYSNIMELLALYRVRVSGIIIQLLEELASHLPYKGRGASRKIDGSYDNVFNATCKMLSLLRHINSEYNLAADDCKSIDIGAVISAAEDWIVRKINDALIYDHDICYCFLFSFGESIYGRLSAATKEKLNKSLETLVESIVAASKSAKIQTRPSTELCRVYKVICTSKHFNIFPDFKVASYVATIESILQDRQDIYGNWRNIAETAEITGMLLEAYHDRKSINPNLHTINVLIAKGIEILHSRFDVNTHSWSNDLNTTAKAMRAIGLYDKLFNYAINDFLLDLRESDLKQIESSGRTALMQGDKVYQSINDLRAKIGGLNEELVIAKEKLLDGEHIMHKRGIINKVLLFTVLTLSFVIVLTFWYLRGTHYDILKEIYSETRSNYFEWGQQAIVGVISSGAAYIIYRKNKTARKQSAQQADKT